MFSFMYLMFGGACLKLKLMSLMTKVNMRVEDMLLHAKNPINMLYFILKEAKNDMVSIFGSNILEVRIRMLCKATLQIGYMKGFDLYVMQIALNLIKANR